MIIELLQLIRKKLTLTPHLIKECRCRNCGSLLAKDLSGNVEIKCRRCKTINKF